MKKAVKITSVLIIAVVIAALFTACVPTSYERAIENLEEAGYLVTSLTEKEVVFEYTVANEFDGATALIVATNGDDGIILLYFESAKKAKASFELFKKRYVPNDDEEEPAVRQGKVLYTSSYEALKAVR